MNQDAGTGKKRALIIAISDYDALPEQLQLPLCKNDGEVMHDTLSGLGYEVTQKRIGTINGQEFKNAIIDFFRDQKIHTKDTMLFYFSGHGVLDGRGGKYFGVTDIDPNIPERVGTTFDFLMEQMEASDSHKTIAILDCCYSASASPNVVGKAGQDPDYEAEKLGRDALKIFEQSRGICVLASSRSNMKSYFIEEKGMSTYTYYLVEGLKGNKDSVDKDGHVTPATLEEFVFSQMKKLESTMQRPVNNLSISGKIILATHEKLRQQSDANHDILELGLMEKGRMFATLGKYKEALPAFEDALKINPNNVDALISKGIILAASNRREESIAYFDKALSIEPDNIVVLTHKATTCMIVKKYLEAKKCLELALKINPSYEPALVLKREFSKILFSDAFRKETDKI